MNQIKKRLIHILIMTMSLSMVGCGKVKRPINTSTIDSNEENKQVIAWVNDCAISQKDYEALYNEYFDYFGGTDEAKRYLDTQTERLIEELIHTEVLMQKAKALSITCTDQEIESAFENEKAQYGEEAFNHMLEAAHLTEQEYRQKMKKQMILMKLQDGMVGSEVELTEQEIVNYYETHQTDYIKSAGAYLKQIYIPIIDEEEEEVLTQAQDTVKNIEEAFKQGDTFDNLYQKYSDRDGDQELYRVEDLGFVAYDSSYVDKTILEVVRTLEEGEVSKAIQTSLGYHFIKVEEIVEARKQSLDEVREHVITTLQEEKKYSVYQEILARWVEEATIKREPLAIK